jgi:hypothetical protein
MNKSSGLAGFEQACRAQNERKAAERGEARANGAQCVLITMFAFGGIDYCQTHGVMGPCPYAVQS